MHEKNTCQLLPNRKQRFLMCVCHTSPYQADKNEKDIWNQVVMELGTAADPWFPKGYLIGLKYEPNLG